MAAQSRANAFRAQILAQQGAPVFGDCCRDTLRCADARAYTAELRPCCRGHLRQIVADTVEELRQFGVTFWADYGTLLGAVRNPLTTWADYPWLPQEHRPEGFLAPGVIPHDKDADFGVLATDWQCVLRVRAALERLGYHVLVRTGGASIKVCLSTLNHTNLDLFAWHAVPNGMLRRVRYISVDAFKGKDFKRDRLDPGATVEWEGMSLPAPSDPAGFCAFRYGPGWRTPIAANHDGVRRP